MPAPSAVPRPTLRTRSWVLAVLTGLLYSIAATTAHATPYHGRFTCTDRLTWVANQPSGYVIGNCVGGTSFYRADKAFGDGNYYDGGFIPDLGFNGCGWIRSDNDVLADPNFQTGGCLPGTISKAPRDFMWVANCRPGSCSDGTRVDIPAGKSCVEAANVRPWGSSLRPSGYVATRPEGYPYLKWRYIVGQNGQPKADAAGTYWVMVHDSQPDAPAGDGSNTWVFVPASCLPNPLPPISGGAYYYP